jgi:hypothetical protein
VVSATIALFAAGSVIDWVVALLVMVVVMLGAPWLGCLAAARSGSCRVGKEIMREGSPEKEGREDLASQHYHQR